MSSEEYYKNEAEESVMEDMIMKAEGEKAVLFLVFIFLFFFNC